MLRKFFCFAHRSEAEASGNAGRVNRQNLEDFAQKKFGFRPTDTTPSFIPQNCPVGAVLG